MKNVNDLTPEQALELVAREAANAGVNPPHANARMDAVILDALRANPKTIPAFVAEHRRRVLKELGHAS